MNKLSSIGSKEDYWRKLIEQWQNGDLSQKAFCSSKGVSAGCFYYWKRKLTGRQLNDQKVAFHPLTVSAPSAGENSSTRNGSGLSLLLSNGKYRLELSDDFSLKALKKVLMVMEAL